MFIVRNSDSFSQQNTADLIAKCDDLIGLDRRNLLVHERQVLLKHIVFQCCSISLCALGQIGDIDALGSQMPIQFLSKLMIP